ncbi:MAG TPA: AfsR/SARP family transcriptional regulator [Ilumatobacteraceae bacterium]|nr:AfsR/SARP family transcriptional regulator [Ilumatobacteraceae bacterium]
MAERIDVRVLGRPHVRVGGSLAPITGRQMLLMLRLVVADHVSLSLGRLVDDVWPEGSGTDGAARVALTRLRTVLGHDAISRFQHGYALAPDVDVDATRFEELHRRARDRSLDLRARIRLLDKALDEWSGPAFDDVDRPSWLAAEAVRLDELHEQAVDLRFELRLVNDEPGSLIADLRTALDKMPGRERRAEMLALALYRSGRQADALDIVTRTRDTLRESIGLAVSPALSELELRILRQDPDLLSMARRHASRGAADADARLRAAVALIRTGVYEEALTIVDDTITDARVDNDERTLAHALLAQAQALSLSGGGDPHASIDQAQAIARALADGPLLAKVALVRVGSGVPEDKSAALVELTEPLELLAADAPERVDLLCAAAVIVTFIDASPAAERLLEAARQAYESSTSLRSEAAWLAARSIVTAVHGADADTVHEMAANAYEVARRACDPTVTVAAIQALLRAEYMAGNLVAVDALLPELEQASATALLPFGAIRVLLSRTTNAIARGELAQVQPLIDATMKEGGRYRTFNTETAVAVQQLLLLFEHDELALLADLVRLRAKERGPSVWHAVLALCDLGVGDEPLVEIAPDVPVDDAFWPFVAYAAEAGARRRDAAIGTWCATRLDSLRDSTITVGLGTVVIGFAAHYAGLARVAIGDLEGARTRLEHAIALAGRSGASLWQAHSMVELADVLVRSDASDAGADARRLHDELACSPVVDGSARLTRRIVEVAEYVGAAVLR